MSRAPNAVPVYRHHKPTGQPVCTVRLANGGRRDVYLGKHNSPASRSEFGRIVSVVAANGGIYPTAAADVTVNELLVAYVKFATSYYRTPEGDTSPTVDRLKNTLRGLRALFGPSPAEEFGPKAFKVLIASWVKEGLSRKTINSRIGDVKRLFRWAVGEELIGAEAHQRLLAVEGLRAGRTEAPDRAPVRPAVMTDVQSALPHMPEPIRAIVLLQVHSAARAGELIKLRVGDIDRGDPSAWSFTPTSHKGTWRGKRRVIYFGKRCREILTPLIEKASGPNAYVFSPERSEADRNAERSANRKTPRYPSHMKRNETKRVGAKRKRPPAERYNRLGYLRAITRACDRAFDLPPELAPRRKDDGKTESRREWWSRLDEEQKGKVKLWRTAHHWHPNQLRHSYATKVRKAHGLEAAQVLLGHSRADVTQVYAERNEELAVSVASKIG